MLDHQDTKERGADHYYPLKPMVFIGFFNLGLTKLWIKW